MTRHIPQPDNHIRCATSAEAEIWFEHQQTEGGMKPLVHAAPLLADTDAGPLVTRFVRQCTSAPELLRCYQFDDNGELQVLLGKAEPDVRILRAPSALDIDGFIDSSAADVWDLAEQPPLRLAIILAPDSAHAALLCHPIAADHAETAELRAALLPQGAQHTTGPGCDMTRIILDEFRIALDAPEMTPDCDFFDLGGHSLIATRVIGRLHARHNIEVGFNDLFAHPTAASLSPLARRTSVVEAPAPVAIAPVAQNARAPLSLAQQSLWKIYEALGFGPMFNIPFALRFLDTVDEHAFAAAFRDLMERHPALRSLFIPQDGAVVQECVPMSVVDTMQWFWPSDGAVDVRAALGAEAGHTFDLSQELPLRMRFFEDADGQTLSFLFHHIVLDEWSVNLLMDELATAYQARAIGQAPRWSHEAASFHDFARNQARAGVSQYALGYWLDALKDAPDPRPIRAAAAGPLPLDTGHAADGGWTEILLPVDVSEGLYALSKDCSASLFNTVYAAISASLQRLAGLDALTIGTSASGRIDAECFDTVGYFTTVTAHCTSAPGHQTPRGLIANVRDMINGSLPHSEIPIDLVEEALTGGKAPLADHMFEVFIQIHAQNKLNGTLPGPNGPIRFRQIDPEKSESVLGLQFEVVEDVIDGVKRLRIMMSYRRANYTPQDVAALISAVKGGCTAFAGVNAADRPLADLLS
ncbi:condensation domain-containing protein [Falsirhodobacter sp. alg1]|uniref:condensation domain-containing protein n=1 Tax=Falsirhodobacter sp. alg1 TaxID=1472418 RepID=UPI000787E878|nr:condensation domain-containing protein [Falsirhodobacter sp. alg1]